MNKFKYYIEKDFQTGYPVRIVEIEYINDICTTTVPARILVEGLLFYSLEEIKDYRLCNCSENCKINKKLNELVDSEIRKSLFNRPSNTVTTSSSNFIFTNPNPNYNIAQNILDRHGYLISKEEEDKLRIEAISFSDAYERMFSELERNKLLRGVLEKVISDIVYEGQVNYKDSKNIAKYVATELIEYFLNIKYEVYV